MGFVCSSLFVGGVKRRKKKRERYIEHFILLFVYFLGKKLTEDELNSLIAHAHRRIEQLQKQLAEQIAMEQQVAIIL